MSKDEGIKIFVNSRDQSLCCTWRGRRILVESRSNLPDSPLRLCNILTILPPPPSPPPHWRYLQSVFYISRFILLWHVILQNPPILLHPHDKNWLVPCMSPNFNIKFKWNSSYRFAANIIQNSTCGNLSKFWALFFDDRTLDSPDLNLWWIHSADWYSEDDFDAFQPNGLVN